MLHQLEINQYNPLLNIFSLQGNFWDASLFAYSRGILCGSWIFLVTLVAC